MAYELLNPQPSQRVESLQWDDLGPGLYKDETALKLDDDTLVAVSVEPKWMETGSGVLFTGWARWIEANGQTHLCGHGQQIETAFTFHADAATVAEYGIQFIAKEMLHMLLGEPLTMTATHDQDGNDIEIPTLMWSDIVILNASIRHAVKSVCDTGPNSINPASILGL